MSFEPLDPTRAEVRITGEAPNYGLDFYIPRGERGAVGPVGPMGPAVPTQLAIGEVVTGPETPGIVGPQGPTGAQGIPGGFTTGTDLAASDLNTITTPGLYRQANSANVTLALNYPLAGASGTGILTVTEQSAGGGGGTLQIYDIVWGNSSGRLSYHRTKTNGSWQPWRSFVDVRIDQAAGRAAYMWDPINLREQLIYGDTGLRDITSQVNAAFFDNTGAARQIFIRRVGLMVTVSGQMLSTASSSNVSALTVASGFKPQALVEATALQIRGNASHIRAYSTAASSTISLATISGSPLGGLVAGDVINVGFSYPTAETWPTVLPGTASGTIPNT